MPSMSQGFVRQRARVVSSMCVFPHNFRKLKTLSSPNGRGTAEERNTEAAELEMRWSLPSKCDSLA